MKKTPPRLAEWLMNNLCWSDFRDALIENLKEEFLERSVEQGQFVARWWYRKQVMRSVLPFMGHETRWRIAMLMNFVKTAFRHFRKQKIHSCIHLAGLAIGLACCMLIALWVQDEFQFDQFNQNIDKMFLVIHYTEGETNSNSSSLPAPLVPHLKDKYPEIRSAARFRNSGRRLFTHNGNNRYEDNGGFADPELFDLFSFKTVLGDPKTALQGLNTIVLTRSMAERYFGSENPLEQILRLENQTDFRVGAVVEDFPMNSSIRFDYIVPFENYGRFANVDLTDWGRYEGYRGFAILQDGVDADGFSTRIRDEIINNQGGSDERVGLHPFKHIRLAGLNHNGTSKSVFLFSGIAVLILLIACINFVNLATAQAGKRMREIGLRKVVGASKSLIRRQIYSELFVLVTIAFILAILLAALFVPKLNAISGKTLSFSLTGNPVLFLLMFGIVLFTALVSGAYPALYMSSFHPSKVMRASAPMGSGQALLRKILVTAQFTISIILIVSTLVIGRQMRYVRNRELGFDKEHLIYIQLLGNLKSQFESVKNELLTYAGVRGVTAATSLPNNAANSAGGLDWEGRSPDIEGQMGFVSVEKDYFRTVGIGFVEGGTFTSIPSNQRLAEFIVNEKAVEMMGVGNPVGKYFRMWSFEPGRIIGIVKNVHNTSLHREITPVFYVQFPYFNNYLIINIQGEDIPQTIESIRNVCLRFNPEYPFEFHFLNEYIDQFYQIEAQTQNIIAVFSALAIFISCLGLFGLSLFMAERRTKEIGIRKTCGASVSSIVGLMSREFLQLVLFSNLIAWPAAYFIMNAWLRNFVYKTHLSVWIFLLSGLSVLGVALITVSTQSVKAASANPVRALRCE